MAARSGRRGLATALLALAAGSLATRVASALPRRFERLLHEANELLRPLGLSVTARDGRTSFEHFDPQKSAINPCWQSTVVEGRAGDSTTVTVIDTAIDFSVVVGGRTWRLVNGALGETRV